MAIALRRFGGGMAAWVAGCVMVGSAVALWDVVTYSLFNPLFSLHQGRWQQPGGFLWWLSGVLLTGFWPAWALWAATIGANVAALAKLGKYKAAAVFAIGFGPALGTILLEGHLPVSGGPMILLVPLWLLIMALDTCAAWGVAWCIVALAKQAKMAWREGGKLWREEPKEGYAILAVWVVIVFLLGEAEGAAFCEMRRGLCASFARLGRARALQRLFSEAVRDIPALLYWSLWRAKRRVSFWR